jgi:hypothetical protein
LLFISRIKAYKGDVFFLEVTKLGLGNQSAILAGSFLSAVALAEEDSLRSLSGLDGFLLSVQKK